MIGFRTQIGIRFAFEAQIGTCLALEAVLLEVGHPLEDGGDEVAKVLALEALRDGDLHVEGGDVLCVVGQRLKEDQS